MMTNTNNRPGYILMLTLALIALCMFISTYVFNKGFVFARFTHTMVDREKARQLAYGGIQLGMSQLVVEPAKKEQGKEKEEKPKEGKPAQEPSESARLLKVVLPLLNKPQKFTLKQAIEGVNGTLVLTLGSEEGKININRLYDFEKHKFLGEGQPNGDMKKVFQEIFALIKEKVNADLFADFEKFLKERKYPLNDVTELLKIKSFALFKNTLYFDPGAQSADPQKETIYLTDIFTVHSSKKEIEPWLLSNSLLILLKLKQNNEKPPATEELLKGFKEQSDWKNDWNKIFKPLYGVDFNGLPKAIAGLLNPVFGPKIFNLLSQATVGKVPIGIFSILDREKGSGAAASAMHVRAVYLV